MRLTIRQMMKVVVFSAFACLGPMPMLPAYRVGSMGLPVLLLISIPLGALACLLPSMLLARGVWRLLLMRLFLGVASLSFGLMMLGVVLVMAWAAFLRNPFRAMRHGGEFLKMILITSGVSCLIAGAFFFLLRIIPRNCPSCGRRGLVLVSRRRTIEGLRSHWSCLSCERAFTTFQPEAELASASASS